MDEVLPLEKSVQIEGKIWINHPHVVPRVRHERVQVKRLALLLVKNNLKQKAEVPAFLAKKRKADVQAFREPFQDHAHS